MQSRGKNLCRHTLHFAEDSEISLGSRHTEQSLQSFHLLLHTDPCVAMQRLSCPCRELISLLHCDIPVWHQGSMQKYMAH